MTRRTLVLIVVLVGLSAAAVAADGGSAIVKVEVLDGRNGTFRFTGTPAGELTLGPDLPDNLTAASLAPGSHTTKLESIDQALEQSGYALVNILCDDRQSAQRSFGDIQQRSANFNIDAGETVTCRFVISPPAGNNKVVLLGLTDDREIQSEEFRQSLETACEMAKAIEGVAGMALPEMRGGIAAVRAATGDILSRLGAADYTEDDAMEALGRGVEEICNPDEPDVFVGPFTITYATCMMRMDAQGMVLAIRLPPNATQATMEISILAEQQGIVVNLNRELSATSAVTGPGESSGLTMSATGRTRDILGHLTQEYEFEYSATFSGMGGALEGILQVAGNQAMVGNQAMEMKVTNRGTVWVAPDAPGRDIVSAFYDNFAGGIESGQGIGSFYAGIIRSLAGMVQNGIPLQIDQTLEAPMGMRSTAQSLIVGGPYLLPLEPGLCGTSTIPAGFEIQQLSGDESECDCTCAGFDQFQADAEAKKVERKKMSKKERKALEQSDPANMCMVTCGSKWMRCAMRR